jgi:hypothetical protein
MIKTSGKLRYCSGYRYRVEEPFWVQTEFINEAGQIKSGERVLAERKPDGAIWVYPGFAWNGPGSSSRFDPVPDTKNFMRGSAIHDAWYQAISEGKEQPGRRDVADKFLAAMCRHDGMGWLATRLVLRGVRLLGESHAERRNREVLTAP